MDQRRYMTTHKAWTEWQEIPFRSGSLKHFERINPHAIEDDSQFVNQCDVEVSLSVLDDLRCFGDLDELALYVPAVTMDARDC